MPATPPPRTLRVLLAVSLALAALAGCTTVEVRIPEVAGGTAGPPPRAFRAGAAIVDLTPPPGLPGLGFSAAGQDDFRGHRGRLTARAIVVEDREGDRAAVVCVDLGMSSRLLRARVAEAVSAETGLDVDRIMLAATHTHAGPAGYCSNGWYNVLGSPSPTNGYDARLTAFLVERIAAAVRGACGSLEAASAVVEHAMTEGLVRNRSIEPFQQNEEWADPDDPGDRPDPVDRQLTMLRLASARTGRPIAALFVHTGHNAVVRKENDLFHPDVFGVAVRELERRASGRSPETVFAFAAGCEGDVSFTWNQVDRIPDHGHGEADRLGRALGAQAWKLFAAQRGAARDPDVAHAHAEEAIGGAELTEGRRVAKRPYFGVSTVAGAEDGRSFLYPFIDEGVRAPAGTDHEHAPKPIFLKPLQDELQRRGARPPTIAPVQVLRIAGLHLVGLPVEPTTQLARRVRTDVLDALADEGSIVPEQRIVIVGIANDYMGYCVTSEEYQLQHYEGASTLYGPNEERFFRERAATLAASLPAEHAPAQPRRATPPTTFHPGPEVSRLPTAPAGAPHPRRAGAIAFDEGKGEVAFTWSGLDPARQAVHEGWLVRVERRVGAAEGDEGAETWAPVVVDGLPEDDRGLSFAVRLIDERRGSFTWRTTWTVPDAAPDGRYRFVVAARAGLEPLPSDAFDVGPVGK